MPSNNNGYTKCPFSYGLFLGTASLMVMAMKQQRQKKQTSTLPSLPICEVVFVLGGPGAGKGTQCALLEERLGDHKHTSSRWLHLSAGDLLRAERNRKSQLSQIINAKIANGELVPSSITCQLLEQAMVEAWQKQKITKFLIDGFPRSHENMEAWQQNASLKHHTLKFVLNFECPEEVL
jgi:UMP-CMP kinase